MNFGLVQICLRAALHESTSHEARIAAVALFIGIPMRRVRGYLADVVPPWRWHGGRAAGLSAELPGKAAVRLAAQQAQGSAPLLAGGVSMAIVAVFPVPASWSKKKQRAALAGEVLPTVKPDSDNLSKCKDALNGVAWKDDAQVCVEMVWKVYGLKPGTTFLVKPFAGYVADILELTKLTDSIRKGEDRS